ncbi:MAG: hypothetical protein HY051_03945 [Candidatus Aenigmarchaeota archaeon]|nr:hypothetical protein [Candidatus Aenigmarchaeota archaeon]
MIFMNTVVERDKQELIDAVNGIREDLGQQPYDIEYLSRLTTEDLQKMADNLANEKQNRLEQEAGVREKTRAEFYKNVTFGFLFIVIMLMIIFTISGLFL